jgi:hypothetical protein
MQGIIPISPRLVDIRAPVEVALNLVQVPDVDRPVKVEGGFGRSVAGHDQRRHQAQATEAEKIIRDQGRLGVHGGGS